MISTITHLAVAFMLLWIPLASAAESDGLDTAMRRVIDVARNDVHRERARALWGRDLDAAVALHDPASGKTLVWRHGDRGATETTLPENQPVANTCMDLADSPRALLILPLPEDAEDLATLVWHERWHCAQAALGLPPREAGNSHLDGEAGRVWLRLELRALAHAVAADGDGEDAAMHRHIRAALAFRASRAPDGGLASGALLDEATVERNEGLAEYSGRRIASSDAALRTRLRSALAEGERRESFVRTVAYLTGTAYGVLLDRLAPEWRRRLETGSDLPSLLALAAGIDPATADQGAERLATDYGVRGIRAEETKREGARQQRAAALRARLVTGVVLRAPLRMPSLSFDPRSLFPLGDDGTVYAPVVVSDGWGRLDAEGGGLLAPDWDGIRVDGTGLRGCGARWSGAGWRLDLAAGWTIARDGSGWIVTEGALTPCEAAQD